MDINIVITMAGLGSRFRKIGLNKNKQDIVVCGRTLFEWSMLSLKNFYGEPFVFVAHKDRINLSLFEKTCQQLKIYRKQLVLLDHTTDGQATTVLAAEPYLELTYPIIVFNIDTYFSHNCIRKEDIQINDAGFIPLFYANDPCYSYALIKGDRIIRIQEKVCISSFATVGLYYFWSFQLFKAIYRETYPFNSNGEKYIAPMYQCLIDRRERVGYKVLETQPYVLGTPEEIQDFCSHFRENDL